MKRQDLIQVIEQAQIAMVGVLDNWASGDLAGAVRELSRVKTEYVDPAIRWWESDD